MSNDVPALLAALVDLEEVGEGRYMGHLPAELVANWRTFGGALMAQMLRAAIFSASPDRRPHTMHTFFLNPGRVELPTEIAVQVLNDGKSFSARQVTAGQNGRICCTATVSFAVAHGGADVSWPLRADVRLPGPATLPAPVLGQPGIATPYEIHELATDWSPASDQPSSTRLIWLRLRESTNGDPALEDCALAYISDLGAGFSARKLVGATIETRGVFASLNHSIWWHRTPRMNDWTLLDFCPISAAHSRGLVRASMHSQDGTHVASIVQEALMRVARDDHHHGLVP